jgi:murein L,D-transpeptidase YcbB/YkuD
MRRRAGRFERPAPVPLLKSCIAAALALAVLPAPARAQFAAPALQSAIRSAGGSDRETRAFYQAHGFRPLWSRGGTIGPEADRLLELIETADSEGLDPDDYRPRRLRDAIEDAREKGSPKALARAEMQLSRSFADYARDTSRPPRTNGMTYVDKALAPTPVTTRGILESAAAAPSLQTYVDEMGWMNPIYGKLRTALASNWGRGSQLSEQQIRLLQINLDRARALPANPGRRYIVVDAAGARLWMYENGQVRDSMKVIVGKSDQQTPMMAALIRFAMVNPYWNIPPDLVKSRVADGVLSKGVGFLKTKGFEVTSDWSDNARRVDPRTVDWKGVASGRIELPVRQLPGKDNAMGRMKFMFPNEFGVYLHDTPEKNLFAKADRRFSSGCVRLEDAPRLARWLFGKPLAPKSKAPEQKVDLPEPVPVFITYLTAAPEGQTIAFRPDVYNRDGAQMAAIEGGSFEGR